MFLEFGEVEHGNRRALRDYFIRHGPRYRKKATTTNANCLWKTNCARDIVLVVDDDVGGDERRGYGVSGGKDG